MSELPTNTHTKAKHRASAKSIAVRLLARREHSEYELSQKLAQREFDAEEIERVLLELRQGGWVSDQRFAEAYIRMRQLKGFGPVRIQMELRERGVDEHIVEDAIDTEADDWLIALQQQYEKKYRNKSISDYADKAKRMRFLQYRGFTLDAIHRVVK